MADANEVAFWRAECERLAEAVEKAAVWFDEYAFQHGCKATQTGDLEERASRLDKAKRNKERADELRATLTSHTIRLIDGAPS